MSHGATYGKVAATVVCVVALSLASQAHAAPLPVTGTLDLATEADLRLDGDAPDGLAGYRVAAAGDVNGDGRADLVAGAPLASTNDRKASGSVYVHFGAAGKGPIPLGSLGAAGLRIDGAAAWDLAGAAVAGAGDVSGDGLADILVGAPGAGGPDHPRRGAVYLVLGRSQGAVIDLAQPGSAAFVVTGEAAGDMLGWAVGGGTDVDGDGRADTAIGAPFATTRDRGRTGAAYVVTAHGGALDAAGLGAGGYRIDGPAAGDAAGYSVALSPDVNGDRRGEVLVGAPGLGPAAGTDPKATSPGGAYTIFGQGSASGVDLASLGDRGITMTGSAGDAAGFSLAALPDVNADGRADLAVGAPAANPRGRSRAGSTFVVHAAAAAGTLALPAPPGRGFRIDGAAPNDLSGWSVAGLGPKPDFNGDGLADLVIGAPFAEPLSRTRAGAAYVVFGAKAGVAAPDIDLVALGQNGVRLAGAAGGDGAGGSVAAAGDVNADATPDVAIGAASATPGKVRTGAVHLVSAPPVVAVEAPKPPDAGAAEELAADCKASTNTEVIIDDSGSMGASDPELLRRRAVELLIGKPRNAGKVLGALEFGDGATTVFSPVALLGPGPDSNQRRLIGALEANIKADAGSTNYNAGFERASQENSAADTRIFLTDGAHNVGAYANLHRGGPRTYVIGLGIGGKGRDAARLQRIAIDTAGAYIPSVKAQELQTAINEIDSETNCDIGLTTDPEVVTDTRATPMASAPLKRVTRSVDVTLSWTRPQSAFDLRRIEVRSKQRSLIAGLGRRQLRQALKPGVHRFGALRVQGSRGATFVTYRLSGVRGARLRTRAHVRRLGAKRDTVTTQVAQSRRRR